MHFNGLLRSTDFPFFSENFVSFSSVKVSSWILFGISMDLCEILPFLGFGTGKFCFLKEFLVNLSGPWSLHLNGLLWWSNFPVFRQKFCLILVCESVNLNFLCYSNGFYKEFDFVRSFSLVGTDFNFVRCFGKDSEVVELTQFSLFTNSLKFLISLECNS